MKNVVRSVLALAVGVLAASVLLGADTAGKTVIPAGTTIDVTLITAINSSDDTNGEGFTAEIQNPVFAEGAEVVPAGSKLHGHVAFVHPPGRLKGKGELRLVADSISTKDGRDFSLSGTLTNNVDSPVKVKGSEGTIQGPGKSGKEEAKDAGIGAAIGAGAGDIGAGGKGAAIGAGVGALAGLIKVLASHHKGVVLDPGTPLTFVLTSAATESKTAKSNAASAPFVCQDCK